MNCDELRPVIDAYLDDELDLVTSVAATRHLQTCPDCAQLLKDRQALQKILHTVPLYAQPVGGLDALQARLLVTLRQVDSTPTAPAKSASISRRLSQMPNRQRIGVMGGLLAALIVIALLFIGLQRGSVSSPSTTSQIAQEVLTSHIRSLMADHLLDVVSTDLHTVKPWFDGKLNFSPTVIDFTAEGFPLVGGRLDYIDQRAVAALVYQRQKHYINVYLWPSGEISNDPIQRFNGQGFQGYNEFYWSQNGTDYWAVSDLNETDLYNFVMLIQTNTAGNDK